MLICWRVCVCVCVCTAATCLCMCLDSKLEIEFDGFTFEFLNQEFQLSCLKLYQLTNAELSLVWYIDFI